MAKGQPPEFDMLGLLADEINMAINETPERVGVHTGFVLMVLPMQGREGDSPFRGTTYCSNLTRQSAAASMRQLAAYLEGWPEIKGRS